MRDAVEHLGLKVDTASLLPDKSLELKARDGRSVVLRTDPMGVVEHVGLPLFDDMLRFLQPSPVYDFLEYAVLNWKYQVNPNQLYLEKVQFEIGSWEILLSHPLKSLECSIENRDDRSYIVSWKSNESNVAVINIPIEYELLNNDSRRNMERDFLNDLTEDRLLPLTRKSIPVNEDELNLYGTEGLFVKQGKFYIVDFLNQNVYYDLITVRESADTIIRGKPVTMSLEAVMPVVVNNLEFPAETFANLMMSDDASVPEVTIDLDFHLSNYHRERVSMPLSVLKVFCRQHGCDLYFAYDGIRGEYLRGVMFASNLPNGYNHLFSLRIPKDELIKEHPIVQADVYLYIPPISKEKLFGITPTKKSGANFNLPK